MEKGTLKPKYVDEWGLSKKAEAIVNYELGNWLNEFIKRADGHMGNPQRCDFKKDELFYFTDCRDILSKTGESRAYEHDIKVQKRKRNVLMQLFLRQLLSNDLKLPRKECTHCGYAPMDIKGCENGYYEFCPKCKRVVIDTYLTPVLIPAVIDVQKKIMQKQRKIDFCNVVEEIYGEIE